MLSGKAVIGRMVLLNTARAKQANNIAQNALANHRHRD